MQEEHPSANPIRILHLEDSAVDHALVQRALSKSGDRYDMERVESLDEFERLVQTHNFDVILADYRLPGFTALDAWQVLLQCAPPPAFYIVVWRDW